MISSVLQPDLLLAVLWTVIAWVAGVAWAAYRALGWVDRMRQWAVTVEEPSPEAVTLLRRPEGSAS